MNLEFIYIFNLILEVEGLSLALLLHNTSLGGQSSYMCRWKNFMSVERIRNWNSFALSMKVWELKGLRLALNTS